jgi:hypothetical protein
MDKLASEAILLGCAGQKSILALFFSSKDRAEL